MSGAEEVIRLGEIAKARAAFATADNNYRNPPLDWDMDDVKWAYEARWRAERNLIALGVSGFDVV